MHYLDVITSSLSRTVLESFCFCCRSSDSLSVTSVYSDMASFLCDTASFSSLDCSFSFS